MTMIDKWEWIKVRHEEGCIDSAFDDRAWLLAEVERLRAEVERLRAVYVLIATESAGIVEGYSIFEDKIVGCYTSYVAADMSGEKIGYVNWRIEEHEIIDDVLVGKGLPR